MGRTSTARDRLLDAACELLKSRAYSSIGVAEICARADVRKGSFYHFFESKQALTLAVVEAHWATQRTDWVGLLQAPGEAPVRRLELLFSSVAEVQRAAQREFGAVSGCLLANLALELSSGEQVILDRLAGIFEEEIELVHAVLAEAAAAGEVASADRESARAAVAQLEGQVLFAKVTDDPAVLDGLWPQVARLLGAAA